ncbi:expressed unknown protein [Seminavis robusta]|uniref:Uncharacterized protein n=1 Tax=Seminavis robusta TaxID=568900 RepID=A0A9N8HHP8_9STRA|nr:expressed unknown protein [Seminavis robusta]|eukprot:Sro721_g192720.1 n/a (977) ;mRNA; r:8278-11208
MKTSRSSASRGKRSAHSRGKPKEVDVYEQLRNSLISAAELTSGGVSSNMFVCGGAWRARKQSVWEVHYTPWDQPDNHWYVATIHSTGSRRGSRSSRLPPRDVFESLLMVAELQYFVVKVFDKFGVTPMEPDPEEEYWCSDRFKEKIDVGMLLPELGKFGLAGRLLRRMMSTEGQKTDKGGWRVEPEQAYALDIKEWRPEIVLGPEEIQQSKAKSMQASSQQPSSGKETDATLYAGRPVPLPGVKKQKVMNPSSQRGRHRGAGFQPVSILANNRPVVAKVADDEMTNNGPVVSESDHSTDDDECKEWSDNNQARPKKQTKALHHEASHSETDVSTLHQDRARLAGRQSSRPRVKKRPYGAGTSSMLDSTALEGQTDAFNSGSLHRQYHRMGLGPQPHSPGRTHEHAEEVEVQEHYQNEDAQADKDYEPLEDDMTLEDHGEEQTLSSDDGTRQPFLRPRSTRKRKSPHMPELTTSGEVDSTANLARPRQPADSSEVSASAEPVRKSKRARKEVQRYDDTNYAKPPRGVAKDKDGQAESAGNPGEHQGHSRGMATRSHRTDPRLETDDGNGQDDEHPSVRFEDPPTKTRTSGRIVSSRTNAICPRLCLLHVKVNGRFLAEPLEALMCAEGIPREESGEQSSKKYSLRERVARSYSEDDSESHYEEVAQADNASLPPEAEHAASDEDDEVAPTSTGPPFVLSTSNRLTTLNLVHEYNDVACKRHELCFPLGSYRNDESAKEALESLRTQMEELNEKQPFVDPDEDDFLAEQQLHNRTMRIMQGRRSQEKSMRYNEKEHAEHMANVARQQQWINKKKAPTIEETEWEEVLDRRIQFSTCRTMRTRRICGSENCPCETSGTRTTRGASTGNAKADAPSCRLCSGAANSAEDTCIPDKNIMPLCRLIDTDAPEFLERDAEVNEDEQKQNEEPTEKKSTRVSKRMQFDAQKRHETIMKLSEIERSVDFIEQYNAGLLEKITTGA